MFVTCSYLSKSDSLGKFIWADVFPDKFEDYNYGSPYGNFGGYGDNFGNNDNGFGFL